MRHRFPKTSLGGKTMGLEGLGDKDIEKGGSFGPYSDWKAFWPCFLSR